MATKTTEEEEEEEEETTTIMIETEKGTNGSTKGGSDEPPSNGKESDDDDEEEEGDENDNHPRNGTEPSIRNGSKPKKKSKRYGLIFPPSRASQNLRRDCGVPSVGFKGGKVGSIVFKRFNVGPKSCIALAAVLESLCGLLFDRAVVVTLGYKKKTVSPHHIKMGIDHDPDLKFLVSGGGQEMLMGGTGTGVDPSVFTDRIKRERDLAMEIKKIEKRTRDEIKEKRQQVVDEVSVRHEKFLSKSGHKKRKSS